MFARKWSRRTPWIAAALVLVALSTAFVFHNRQASTVALVPFSDLLRDLDRGVVEEVVVSGDTLDFKRADGHAFRTLAPANYVTANAAFVSDLAKKGVRIDVRRRPTRRRTAMARSW